VSDLGSKLAARDGYWNARGSQSGDKTYCGELIELRNALAHGNQGQVESLRRRGILDTVTWARSRLPGLDRFARALDRAVRGTVVEVWGNPPSRVRVELDFDEDEDPVVLLLSPSIMSAA
jgi:hypothetical protein